jgi:hypothetical protein
MGPWNSFYRPIAIIPWTDGHHSMHPWKSCYAPMEIIPCPLGNHSTDPCNSIEAMVTKDMEITACTEVIISIDDWNFCAPSIQRKFPLDTWKYFHSRL